MGQALKGKSVAILATDGYEQSELESPYQALDEAGATVKIVSIKKGQITGWKDGNWGSSRAVDLLVAEVNPDNFDAIILPGGVMNPDKLRNDPNAVAFVRHFIETGKPICAICHGPWTLINAEGVKGARLTSYASIRMDLENAGAKWVDEEVVVDNGLITSRDSNDLPAFNKKMIEEIQEGIHTERT